MDWQNENVSASHTQSDPPFQDWGYYRRTLVRQGCAEGVIDLHCGAIVIGIHARVPQRTLGYPGGFKTGTGLNDVMSCFREAAYWNRCM